MILETKGLDAVPNNPNISLPDFWDALNRNDWTFYMSDDHSVYCAGTQAEAKLIAMSKQSPEHQSLFTAFREHIFSGPHWHNEDERLKTKQPKPVRPS